MTKSGQPPKSFTTETRVVRKNRSAGVSPASEPRQLLLGQHDLCRLEAGDTFFLTTTEFTEMRGEYLLGATWQGFLLLGAQVSCGEIVWLMRRWSVAVSDSPVPGVRNCFGEMLSWCG